MREIKFRQPLHVGREPTPNTFTKWHYWGFIDGTFIGPETNYDSVEHARRYSEEYIGLKDDNGEEIYEGDNIGEIGYAYRVEFEDGVFRLAHSTSVIDWIYSRKRRGLETTVIGNSYEKPEESNT